MLATLKKLIERLNLFVDSQPDPVLEEGELGQAPGHEESGEGKPGTEETAQRER